MMEKYFFIPTSSINYNNLLSSESISPPAFYSKRGFGFRRFEKVLPSPFNNSFLAYSQVINFSIKTSDREEFPLYIAIPKEFLKEYKIIDLGRLHTVQIDGCIYLNPEDCFFLVENDEEKNNLIASTQKSVEVKHSERYNKNIFCLNEYHLDSIPWQDSLIDGVSDLKNLEESQLKKSQELNKIKGFLYGYATGIISSQPEELILGKRYFQEFINTFSAIMNELSSYATGKGKNVGFHNNIQNYITNLKALQRKISSSFINKEKNQIDAEMMQDFGLDEDFIISLKNKVSYSNKVSLFTIVSKFLKSQQPNLYSIEELLEQLILSAKNLSSYGNAQKYKALESDFESIVRLIKSRIESFESKEIEVNKLEKLPFKWIKGSEIEVIPNGFSKKEKILFEVISNEFLSRLELSTSDEIGQLRKDFIEGIGIKIRELFNTKDSEELFYLRELYQSLKTVGVGFKPYHIGSLALQSLACFMSRYAELVKLRDYMERNEVKKFHLAYTYWGAAYGFANISKIFISPVADNLQNLRLIREFLDPLIGYDKVDPGQFNEFTFMFKGERRQVIQLDVKPTPQIPKIPSLPSKGKQIEKTIDAKTVSGDFETILQNSKKIKGKTEWVEFLVNEAIKAEQQAKSSKSELFSNQKDEAVRIFKQLISDKTKSPKRFGEDKIKEALNLYTEYLANELNSRRSV